MRGLRREIEREEEEKTELKIKKESIGRFSFIFTLFVSPSVRPVFQQKKVLSAKAFPSAHVLLMHDYLVSFSNQEYVHLN